LFHLVFESHPGTALCRFRREARAAGDIDTVIVDGLKVLDPKRPIREADMGSGDAKLNDAPS